MVDPVQLSGKTQEWSYLSDYFTAKVILFYWVSYKSSFDAAYM